jgi:hypothetical protein
LVRQLEIEHNQIKGAAAGAHAGDQIGGVPGFDGAVARLFHCGAKPIAHDRVVVGTENGFDFDRGARHSRIGYTRDRPARAGF